MSVRQCVVPLWRCWTNRKPWACVIDSLSQNRSCLVLANDTSIRKPVHEKNSHQTHFVFKMTRNSDDNPHHFPSEYSRWFGSEFISGQCWLKRRWPLNKLENVSVNLSWKEENKQDPHWDDSRQQLSLGHVLLARSIRPSALNTAIPVCSYSMRSLSIPPDNHAVQTDGRISPERQLHALMCLVSSRSLREPLSSTSLTTSPGSKFVGICVPKFNCFKTLMNLHIPCCFHYVTLCTHATRFCFSTIFPFYTKWRNGQRNDGQVTDVCMAEFATLLSDHGTFSFT